jgi:hypothetical protein
MANWGRSDGEKGKRGGCGRRDAGTEKVCCCGYCVGF